jgi:hypothetical protein
VNSERIGGILQGMLEVLSMDAGRIVPLVAAQQSDPAQGLAAAAFARPVRAAIRDAAVRTPPFARPPAAESEDARNRKSPQLPSRAARIRGTSALPSGARAFPDFRTAADTTPQGPATLFLAQQIAQETLASWAPAPTHPAAVALYRAPVSSRVTVFGPQISLDITV